jgi:hypothetical protein
MNQIQIDLPPLQLSQLKSLAEAAGKTMEEYILEKALPPDDETQAWESLLRSRVAEAKAGEFTSQSVNEIALELFKEMGV